MPWNNSYMGININHWIDIYVLGYYKNGANFKYMKCENGVFLGY